MEPTDGLLDALPAENVPRVRRRKLLPWWIKFFIWLFFAFGLFLPAVPVMIIMKYPFNMGLYGMFTRDPASLAGAILIGVFALKTVVALGLWFEKDWAVDAAIIDGCIGIAICVFLWLIFPAMNESLHTKFRVELLLLIPYLIKMIRIRKEWAEGSTR